MTQPQEGAPQHVVRLEIQNARGIRALSLNDLPEVVDVTGPNQAGKSTVLDAVGFAISGTKVFTDDSITVGEDELSVTVETEDFVLTRAMKRGKSPKLTVRGRDGSAAPLTPAAFVDYLTGKAWAFDLSEFERMDDKARDALFREAAGIDVSDLDNEIATLREERQAQHRAVRAAENLVGPEVDAPDDLVLMTDLLEDQRLAQAARDWNQGKRNELDAAVREEARAGDDMHRKASAVAALEEALEKARAEMVMAERVRDGAAQATAALRLAVQRLTDPNMDDINARIATVSAVNERVLAKQARAERVAAVTQAQAKYDELTAIIGDAETARTERLRSAQLPVPGLSLNDEGAVLWQGAPLSQASRSVQRRVRLALARAMNPRLAVALVHDGSLLDAASRREMVEACKAAGFQVFIETVAQAETATELVINEVVVPRTAAPKGAF